MIQRKPADQYVKSSATITQGRLCSLGNWGTAAAAGQQHAQTAGSGEQNGQRAAQGAHQGAQEDERERAKEAGQGEEGEGEDGSEHEQDQLHKFRQIKKGHKLDKTSFVKGKNLVSPGASPYRQSDAT
jgi:hypothetical protein